jgi:phosphoglycerate dehydrogenase-like enzyme
MRPLNKPFRIIISEKIADLPNADPDISYIYKPDYWRFPRKLARIIQDADGLVVRNQTRVDAALLKNSEALQVVGRLGSGLDNIDIQAAHEAGVQVVYAPGANTISVAEYCLTQILNILRKIPEAMGSTKSGEWSRSEFTGRELSETVIGLIGYGRVAQSLAEKLNHLGGKIIVTTHSPEKVPRSIDTVVLTELLTKADIVSLHIPGGPQTHHLIGSIQFKNMKPTAWLLNTARGSLVDEGALYDALVRGEIAGAVLDVREYEPPAVGNLEALPNFYATPHIAAFTNAAQKRVNQEVFTDVAEVLRGGQPRGVVGD